MEEKTFVDLLERLGVSLKKDINTMEGFISDFKGNYVDFRKGDRKAEEIVIKSVEGMEKFVNGETAYGIPFADAVFCVGGLFSSGATKEQVAETENTLKTNVYGNINILIESIEQIDCLDEKMFMRMYNSLQTWKRNAKEFLKMCKDLASKSKARTTKENVVLKTEEKKQEIETSQKETEFEDDSEELVYETNRVGLKVCSVLSIVAVVIAFLFVRTMSFKIYSAIAYLIIGVLIQRYHLTKIEKTFSDYVFFIIHLPCLVFTILSFVVFNNTDSESENTGFFDKTEKFFAKCENWLDKKIEEGNSKDSDYQFTLTDEHGNKRKLKYNMYVGPGSKKEYKDDVGDTWYTDDEGKHFYRK